MSQNSRFRMFRDFTYFKTALILGLLLILVASNVTSENLSFDARNPKNKYLAKKNPFPKGVVQILEGESMTPDEIDAMNKQIDEENKVKQQKAEETEMKKRKERFKHYKLDETLAMLEKLEKDKLKFEKEGGVKKQEVYKEPQPGQRACDDVCDQVPLIDFGNGLAAMLKTCYQNQLESHSLYEKSPDWKHTDILGLVEGRIGAVFWSIWVPCEAKDRDVVSRALDQIDVVTRMTMKYHKTFEFSKSSGEMYETFAKGKIASLFGISGGHLLDNRLSLLRLYYKLGARYLRINEQNCTNAWSKTWESNTGKDFLDVSKGLDDLSGFGVNVVMEAMRLGMIIDLSYSSTKTILKVIGMANDVKIPVIFGSSNSFTVHYDPRNINDNILQEIKHNGGLVMVNIQHQMVGTNDKQKSTIIEFVKHLNHIKDLIGIDHIGLGAGFDSFAKNNEDLQDVSDYLNVFEVLERDYEGFTPWTKNELKKLAGGNLLRVFKLVEEAGESLRTEHPPMQPVEERISYSELAGSIRDYGDCRSDIETYQKDYAIKDYTADMYSDEIFKRTPLMETIVSWRNTLSSKLQVREEEDR